MKKLIVSLLLTLPQVVAVAQIGYTLNEVIELFGRDYEVGYNNDSIFYLFYNQVEAYKDNSQKYDLIAYFTSDKTDALCFAKTVIMPISEINHVISTYNKKYVKLSDLKWQDYESNIIYYVKAIHKDEVFTVTSILTLEE